MNDLDISVDADLTRSTLKLIVETAQTTLTFILYAGGLYVVSFILKRYSALPFRGAAFVGRWVLYALEKTVFGVAWLGSWVALLAIGVLVIVLGMCVIAYALYAHEAQLTAWQARRPRSARVAMEAVAHSPIGVLWLIASRGGRWGWLRWVMWPLVALACGRLAAFALGLSGVVWRSRWRRRETAVGINNDDERLRSIREAVAKAEAERDRRKAEAEARGAEEDEAEMWARKAREDMLKEGLAKRAGKKASTTAAGEGGVDAPE